MTYLLSPLSNKDSLEHGAHVGQQTLLMRRNTMQRSLADPVLLLHTDDGARVMDTCDSQPADAEAAAAGPVLPMLASACPGWVCYAEKTQGAWVLPHISSAKSPQAVQGYDARLRLPVWWSRIRPFWETTAELARQSPVMGRLPCRACRSLVKQWLAPRLGRKASAVYHCAVMPCFDKKLEASREDFQLPGYCI